MPQGAGGVPARLCCGHAFGPDAAGLGEAQQNGDRLGDWRVADGVIVDLPLADAEQVGGRHLREAEVGEDHPQRRRFSQGARSCQAAIVELQARVEEVEEDGAGSLTTGKLNAVPAAFKGRPQS
jgi:hypothetical protein